MTDYKNTLNLPKTAFPMKASLAEREPMILSKWQAMSLYAKLRTQNQDKPKYILHDGPPYANGPIHMGHAVNKILKDMIVKWKNLNGFDAPFVPGWDCHGLPIELNVEKKQRSAKQSLSAPEFRQACRQHAEQQIIQQREAFKRLGVLADWEHPYRTMDFRYEANVIRALGKIIANGHLQQGFKPVHWCVNCRSALAEAEVEYVNKVSVAIDVRFSVIDTAGFQQRLNHPAGQGPITIPIWTTTPWTLPANEAVALGPHLDYSLIQISGERLLIASALLETCLKRYGVAHYQILGQCRGAQLQGLLLQHPFYPRQVSVILAGHVDQAVGTGAVHTAPAHGQEDYLIGLQYRLPLVNPVGDDGRYLRETPLFGGESAFQVDPLMLAVLRQQNKLLAEQSIEHSYPHCWRHKIPLIFRATRQWFISLQQSNLGEAAWQASKKVQWIPEWGLTRIEAMLRDRPDWCLSRQRNWGVPMPLFIHRTTGELHPQTLTLLAQVADRVEQSGIEAWHNQNPEECLGQTAQEYEKLTATLDVWFDSGVSHYCVLTQDPHLDWPADLYLEGSDQYRGWFQSSLLTAVAINGQAPYRTVLTHGYTVDEQGRKMSKSLGNVVAPDQVINRLGADVLRLWVASVDYRTEIAISDEILHRIAEAYRRIRNTLRFLLANLHDFEPGKDGVMPEQLLSLDRWILERAALLQQDIQQAYSHYHFHTIYHKLHNFCINELGSFYLDIIKDRQYTLPQSSLARRSAQTAIYHIAEALLRWLAPILSFTAEEAWSCLPGLRPESVFLSEGCLLNASLSTDPLATIYQRVGGRQAYWERLIQVRQAVNKELEKWRHAGHLGSALEAEITLYGHPEALLTSTLQALQTELHFFLITSAACISTIEPPSQAVNVIIQGECLAVSIISIAACKTKCARCWHRCDDVGLDPQHPTICLRCVANLPGKIGEQRNYV